MNLHHAEPADQARTLEERWATGPWFKGVWRDYTATTRQREVGAGYFDQVRLSVSGGEASTSALAGATAEKQF